LNIKKKPKKITTEINEVNNNIKKDQLFIDLIFVGNKTNVLGKKIINLMKNVRQDFLCIQNRQGLGDESRFLKILTIISPVRNAYFVGIITNQDFSTKKSEKSP